MPTYSYRCTECGNAFDTVQTFTYDALTECPACGGRLRKVFAAVGVSFNGSGFYRNDSKAAGKAESSPSGASSASSAADSGSSGSSTASASGGSSGGSGASGGAES